MSVLFLFLLFSPSCTAESDQETSTDFFSAQNASSHVFSPRWDGGSQFMKWEEASPENEMSKEKSLAAYARRIEEEGSLFIYSKNAITEFEAYVEYMTQKGKRLSSISKLTLSVHEFGDSDLHHFFQVGADAFSGLRELTLLAGSLSVETLEELEPFSSLAKLTLSRVCRKLTVPSIINFIKGHPNLKEASLRFCPIIDAEALKALRAFNIEVTTEQDDIPSWTERPVFTPAYSQTKKAVSLPKSSPSSWEDWTVVALFLLGGFMSIMVRYLMVELPDSSLCTVCKGVAKCITLIPCGHFCACKTCATQLTECPICRAKIKNRQQTFL